MDLNISPAFSNPAQIQSMASVSVLKMSMDTLEDTGAALVKMMEQSVNPNLGQNIDMKI